jgi:nitrite reductase/ring-hydroxylating ferredoxin subunit
MTAHARRLGIGWFSVALSSELKVEQVRGLQLGGERLVAYRDEQGQPHLFSATCPYDGADLALGDLQGGLLVCPFHGCRFNRNGHCLDSNGNLRPRLALQKKHVAEIAGQVFVAHGSDAAQFDAFFSQETLARLSWTHSSWVVDFDAMRLPENSADLSHYRWVHKSDAFRWVQGPIFDQYTMRSVHEVEQPVRVLGVRIATAMVFLDIRLLYEGVALAMTRTKLAFLNFESVTVSATVPLKDDQWLVHLTTAVKPTRWYTHGIFNRGLRWAVHAEGCKSLEQDFRLWANLAQIPVVEPSEEITTLVAARQWAARFRDGDLEERRRS